jgi:hypothetical protein
MDTLKPDFVIPIESIGVMIATDTKTLGVQFVDSSRKRVLLPLSGRTLHAFWLAIGRALNEHPQVKNWTQGRAL